MDALLEAGAAVDAADSSGWTGEQLVLVPLPLLVLLMLVLVLLVLLVLLLVLLLMCFSSCCS